MGSMAQENVKSYNAGWLFFSSSSLSHDGVISDYSEEETALRLTMYGQAEHSVFLCDSTKLGKASAFRAFALKDIDYAVCDAPMPDEILKSSGMSLIRQEGQVHLYQNKNKA